MEPFYYYWFFLKYFILLVVFPYCLRLEHEKSEEVDNHADYLNRKHNSVLLHSPKIFSVGEVVRVASVYESEAHHCEHEHENSTYYRINC